MSHTPTPVEPTWTNMGERDGRLWFKRELTGKFFIHASIRAGVAARVGQCYAAELGMPDGQRRKMTPDAKTLTDVMAWGLATAKVEAIRIDTYRDPKVAAAAAASRAAAAGEPAKSQGRRAGHYAKKPSTRRPR